MIEQIVLEAIKGYLDRYTVQGTEVIATCPFHRKPGGAPEQHPSFSFSLSRGIYHCHACHEKGTFFGFLQHHGMHPETIKSQYKKTLEHFWANRGESTPSQKKVWGEVHAQKTLPEALLGLFHYLPVDLLQEGFEEETLQHFEVGYDRKQHRVTFPIRNFEGTLIGISGRAYGDVKPRYKVYDTEYQAYELPIHKTNKSMTLWNAHEVLWTNEEKTPLDFIVLVEGYKACMKVWQAGIKNVVALMGSSISRHQAWFLERLGTTVILMLDNDDAGLKGRKEIGNLLNRSLWVRIAEYPAKQPSACSSEEINFSIKRSKAYSTFLIENILNKKKQKQEEKEKANE